MILFPAVDIKNGKAVRLRQGKKTEVDVFSDNPLDMAMRWQDQGAKWLHVIDLDGAFDGYSTNVDIIYGIASRVQIPIQVGGGIRSLDTAKRYLDAGANRLITSTIALEKPELYQQMLAAFPGKIGISVDASNGKIMSRGWQNDTGMTIASLLPSIAESAFLIYTDIARDGMHSGVNLDAMQELLKATALPVLAAGGISTLDDVIAVNSLRQFGNLEGIITGRAIYEGTLNLKEAQEWLDAQQD